MNALLGFQAGLVWGWFIGAMIVAQRFSEFGELGRGIGTFGAFFSPDAFMAGIIGSVIGLLAGAAMDSNAKKKQKDAGEDPVDERPTRRLSHSEKDPKKWYDE